MRSAILVVVAVTAPEGLASAQGTLSREAKRAEVLVLGTLG